MRTPSRVSRRSGYAPCGQMTETSYPASASVVASIHTRRSNGTGRFSTRMRICGDRLSAIVGVAPLAPADAAIGVRGPDETLMAVLRCDRKAEYDGRSFG